MILAVSAWHWSFSSEHRSTRQVMNKPSAIDFSSSSASPHAAKTRLSKTYRSGECERDLADRSLRLYHSQL